eukprot:scaffold967_cov321-Pavlova_lutheri.AAC.17
MGTTKENMFLRKESLGAKEASGDSHKVHIHGSIAPPYPSSRKASFHGRGLHLRHKQDSPRLVMVQFHQQNEMPVRHQGTQPSDRHLELPASEATHGYALLEWGNCAETNWALDF